jgi:hypothetical protein
MAELEKVIYSIERCICHVPDACRDCGYDNEPCPKCFEHLLRDAHDLLKAQEPKRMIGISEFDENISVGRCPSCDQTIVNNNNHPIQFCKYCGQAVKWDE